MLKNRSVNDLPLFASVRRSARRTDPMTSFWAAVENIESGARASQQVRVYRALRRLGGLRMASEIAAELDMDAYVVRKRLPELERLGVVVRDPRHHGLREQLWTVA